MIASLLAAATCAATPVHGEPLPRSGSLSGLPWVQGAPLRRGFFGLLFGYDEELEDPAAPSFALYTHGTSPQGHSTKVLWLVRNRRAGPELSIRGRDLSGSGTFRQGFQQVRDVSEHPALGTGYASIVDLPHAGCWRLDVRTGRARASFVVRAVEP